jgi:predicted phage terminase large subunit-like protein
MPTQPDQPKLSRQEELQLQKLMANYKLTPMTLAMKLNPRIIPARHLMLISSIVASAIAKGGGRIIISLPPRHGKSELITKNVPIWTLENYGRKNVILCSYGGDLSSDFGRQVRDLIKGNESLLNLRIRPDAERVNNWLTDQGGAMYSVGLGGPITGRGADVLVIDDYIKEIKESLSQLHRDYIWDWFVTTAYTRLEPGATVIIVATRWHHDDLIGRLLKAEPEKWTNIVIPAIAEENDILNRPVGTPLFEERYPLSELLDRKKTLGSFFFNALYQQRPENDAGKLTDRRWLKYLQMVPQSLEGFKIARCWDLAATEDGGDYMVGTLLAYHPKRDITIVIDVKRGQLSPLRVEALVAKTAKEDGPDVQVYIEQEPGSSGKLLVHNYSTTTLKGYKVEGVPASPKNNKVTRAQPFLAAVEAGRVFLVQAAWNTDFADEYDEFPSSEHDDQVDTCAIGYTMLSGKKLLRVSWGRGEPRELPNIVKQDAMAAGEADDLIILPNGKTYKMAESLVNSTAQNNDGFPKKAGIIWGRNASPRTRLIGS